MEEEKKEFLSNEVIRNIKKRRSIRKYKKEQLKQEELEAILEAGQYAPSGGNNQTTHLLVIQRQEILSQLIAVTEEEFAKQEVYEGMYKSLRGSILASKKGGYDFTYGAPTLVVAANKKGYGNALADCACVLENMMLAAVSLDIGSCWINQLHWLDENPAVRSLLTALGLKEDETVCGGLVLGYKEGKEGEPLKRTGNPITFIR